MGHHPVDQANARGLIGIYRVSGQQHLFSVSQIYARGGPMPARISGSPKTALSDAN